MTRLVVLILAILFGCSGVEKDNPGAADNPDPLGTLFIIGGGSRPPELVAELASLSNLSGNAYGVVLPMASIEPDSAAWYAIRQFEGHTSAPIVPMFISEATVTPSKLDSIRNAAMIYITGGSRLSR